MPMLSYEIISGITPSYAENIISKELNKRGIIFCQEVYFDGCINLETGFRLRFDFFLPSINTIIEYDGKAFHDDVSTKRRDKIKSCFARKNGINLIRISGIRYIHCAIKSLQVKKCALSKPMPSISILSKRQIIETEVYHLLEKKKISLGRFRKSLNSLKPSIKMDVIRKLKEIGEL